MDSSVSDETNSGRPAITHPMIGFRADPELMAALDEAAEVEGDKPGRSELLRRIVSDWLRMRGHLKG